MNYKLKETNGNVNYLIMAGKDIVLHHINLSAAIWTCEHNEVKNETLCDEHPTFCVHAGSFYFEGEWELLKEKPQKAQKRRTKDRVCE